MIQKTLRIQSADGASFLEFATPLLSQDKRYIEYFSVTFESVNLTASTGVRTYTSDETPQLVTIFRDMKQNWKWQGGKQWKTFGGNFSITFTSGTFGHIITQVQIANDYGGNFNWQVTGLLDFEQGQLPTLVKQVTEFFSV